MPDQDGQLDRARLSAAIDRLANLLQPAVIIADHLQRSTGTIAHDAASLGRYLDQAVAVLKTLQPPRAE